MRILFSVIVVALGFLNLAQAQITFFGHDRSTTTNGNWQFWGYYANYEPAAVGVSTNRPAAPDRGQAWSSTPRTHRVTGPLGLSAAVDLDMNSTQASVTTGAAQPNQAASFSVDLAVRGTLSDPSGRLRWAATQGESQFSAFVQLRQRSNLRLTGAATASVSRADTTLLNGGLYILTLRVMRLSLVDTPIGAMPVFTPVPLEAGVNEINVTSLGGPLSTTHNINLNQDLPPGIYFVQGRSVASGSQPNSNPQSSLQFSGTLTPLPEPNPPQAPMDPEEEELFAAMFSALLPDEYKFKWDEKWLLVPFNDEEDLNLPAKGK